MFLNGRIYADKTADRLVIILKIQVKRCVLLQEISISQWNAKTDPKGSKILIMFLLCLQCYRSISIYLSTIICAF